MRKLSLLIGVFLVLMGVTPLAAKRPNVVFIYDPRLNG